MGVPVVILKGATHAEQMSSSVLINLRLGALIAGKESDCVAIAAGLASDTNRLDALRSGLRELMHGSPMMAEPGFTLALEAVSIQAHKVQADSPDLGLVVASILP